MAIVYGGIHNHDLFSMIMVKGLDIQYTCMQVCVYLIYGIFSIAMQTFTCFFEDGHLKYLAERRITLDQAWYLVIASRVALSLVAIIHMHVLYLFAASFPVYSMWQSSHPTHCKTTLVQSLPQRMRHPQRHQLVLRAILSAMFYCLI